MSQTHGKKSSTARKLVQAAALAAVLVPLGTVAVDDLDDRLRFRKLWNTVPAAGASRKVRGPSISDPTSCSWSSTTR